MAINCHEPPSQGFLRLRSRFSRKQAAIYRRRVLRGIKVSRLFKKPLVKLTRFPFLRPEARFLNERVIRAPPRHLPFRENTCRFLRRGNSAFPNAFFAFWSTTNFVNERRGPGSPLTWLQTVNKPRFKDLAQLRYVRDLRNVRYNTYVGAEIKSKLYGLRRVLEVVFTDRIEVRDVWCVQWELVRWLYCMQDDLCVKTRRLGLMVYPRRIRRWSCRTPLYELKGGHLYGCRCSRNLLNCIFLFVWINFYKNARFFVR